MPGKNRALQRLVGHRRVVHISGFEPIGVDGLDRRMKSGLRKFSALWGANATSTPPVTSEDGRSVLWQVDATGPNWATQTRYTVLRWDELMAPYTGGSWVGRVANGYLALFGLIGNGTLSRYFRANVRYGLFFIYPLLLLAGFVLAGIAAALIAAMLGIPAAPVTAPVLGLVVFAVLLRGLGGYFYLDFALSDWAFAADLARDRIAGLDTVVERFTEEVIAALRDPNADEVLLSSVSLGAVMMAEAIDRVFAREPDANIYMRRATFLTVGSSILKIGLHPEAERLRRLVGRVGAEKDLRWVEYQAKVDPINFYKTDPVKDLGNRRTGRPQVRQIRIRSMMHDADYRRAQRSALHLHRQFVMPNGKRYFYDFYQISFGPLSLPSRVKLGEKATGAFGKDGSVTFEPPTRSRRKRRTPVAAAAQ
ncbi:MAG: hypothetical protein KDK07_14520 [Bauldia sp.]|nr:hypothetical protein [Bauldia sp.]